jgi:hypothetical protein
MGRALTRIWTRQNQQVHLKEIQIQMDAPLRRLMMLEKGTQVRQTPAAMKRKLTIVDERGACSSDDPT